MDHEDTGTTEAGANLTAPMDLDRTLEELLAAAPTRLDEASTVAELDAVAAELVGKRSPIAAARRTLGGLDDAQRRRAGAAINQVANDLTARIEARRRVLAAAAERERLAADRVDVTLPARRLRRGAHHLVAEVMNEIVDIFVSIGYSVATGPEAETEFYNFTALNIPDTHPARLESDTLYLDYGDTPEGVLLRTHTSPMQARYMEQHDPPVYVVVPGRVFRRDPLDPTHSPVFHQVEGLAVDTDITFGDLKGTLAYFAVSSSDRRRRSASSPTTSRSPNRRPRCTSRASPAISGAAASAATPGGSS
jgi:phenylalanyl-tRNA synthetase alpha chain